MIPSTVKAWHDALRFRGIDDEQRDTPRIAEGFQRLAATIDTWPTPSALVKAMPDAERPIFRALPRPELTDGERADRRAFLAIQAQRIAQLQRQNRDDHGPQ